MIQSEDWKDIPGFEGRFQASNIGRIKRLSFSVNNKGKQVVLPEMIRTLGVTKGGYLQVNICGKSFLVHRLVCASFLIQYPERPFVNHKNGIKTHSHLSNLEWCSRSENNKHAYATGLRKSVIGIGKWNKGKHNALNSGKRISANGLFYGGVTEASRATGVPISTIYCHCRGGIKNTVFSYVD